MADESINLRHPLPGFDQRFQPDRVDGPIVSYRPHDFRVEYLAQSMEHWVRATFDRLDSHRVSRGERYPYESGVGGSYDTIEVVQSSGWVAERYSYERRYYGNDYGFTRSVDEMLDEFDHYLLSFHDEFVEVIAGGVYFEEIREPGQEDVGGRPGWVRLPNEVDAAKIGEDDAELFMRESDALEPDLLEAAKLSDQVVLQVDTTLNPTSLWPTMRVTVRNRNGRVVSRLRDSFGGIVDTYDGLPDKNAVIDRIDAWNAERAERVRNMRRKQ